MKINKTNFVVWTFTALLVGYIMLSANATSGYAPSGEYCLWGIPCGDNPNATRFPLEVFMNITLSPQNLTDYNFTDEGVVPNKAPYHENFFKSLGVVLNVSREKYQTEITAVADVGEFDDTYKIYTKRFNRRYSKWLDETTPMDYLQNFGELKANGYKGDCDDYAIFLYLLAEAKGEDVRYVIGWGDDGAHAWIQLKKEGNWTDYDSTSTTICDDCVSEDYGRRYYFPNATEVEV